MVRYSLWLTAVLLSLASPARLWAGDIHLLSERDGECVIEVVFDSSSTAVPAPAPFLHKPGFPRLHYVRFYVAVPADNRYTIEMKDGHFRDTPGPLPRRTPERSDDPITDAFPGDTGFFPESPFVTSGPFRYRNANVIAVDCFVGQVDTSEKLMRLWSGYTLRIQYPSGGSVEPDPFVSRLVINRNSIPSSQLESQGSVAA